MAALLLTALLLTACGSGEKTLSDPTEQPTAVPIPTEDPSPEPGLRGQGTFRHRFHGRGGGDV